MAEDGVVGGMIRERKWEGCCCACSTERDPAINYEMQGEKREEEEGQLHKARMPQLDLHLIHRSRGGDKAVESSKR